MTTSHILQLVPRPRDEIAEVENQLRPIDLTQWMVLRRMVIELDAAGCARGDILQRYADETRIAPSSLRRWWMRWRFGTGKFPAHDARTLLDTRWLARLWRRRKPQDRDPAPKDVPEFVAHWRSLRLGCKRRRTTAKAWRMLEREWYAGGKIPGYGTWQDWFARRFPDESLPDRCPGMPLGWSEKNLGRLVPDVIQRTLAEEGTGAARKLAPNVIGTREDLQFLEEVTFDDLRLDVRCLDTESGQVCDVWLLLAYDVSCALHLGYGIRLARKRKDGTEEHLRADDMDQLCAYILWRWGVPSYGTRWVLENGTATLPEGRARALMAATDGALQIRYASMIGGKSGAGYAETKRGNSNAKASLESVNGLIHIELSHLPAQTGPSYQRRPADLVAREKEAVRYWELSQTLPEHLRRGMKYPVLTVDQLRAHLDDLFARLANRTKHVIEGFEEVPVWRPGPQSPWQPIETLPDDPPDGYETDCRLESPLERMVRLVEPHKQQWRSAPAAALTQLLQDSQRALTVQVSGEIQMKVGVKTYWFAPPSPEQGLPAGTRVIAHHHRLHFDFIFLAAPDGRVLGCWPRREVVKRGDREALERALRYTATALRESRVAVETALAPERAALEQMRADNAELLASVPESERLPVRDLVRSQKSEVGSQFVAAGTAGLRAARRLEDGDRERDEALAAEQERGVSAERAVSLAESAEAARSLLGET